MHGGTELFDLAMIWLAALAITAVLLLLGRVAVLWYWRVNEALERLKALERILTNIDENLTNAINRSPE